MLDSKRIEACPMSSTAKLTRRFVCCRRIAADAPEPACLIAL
jgi:hypothetical protein